MDFSLPPKVPPLLDEVERFLVEVVRPLEGEVVHAGFTASHAKLDAMRAEAKKRGLWLPQEKLSLLEFAFVSEALGTSPLGHYACNCQAPDAGNMEILRDHATPSQRTQFFEPLVDGKVRSCFSMTEPDRPGSNPTWLDTRAVVDGDTIVINGRKWFTSSADGAAFAIVMAVTDEDAPMHQRASMILVPMSTKGVKLVRNISVMGEPGSGWASHAEIVYEDVRVPAANVLGKKGEGFAIAQERLGPGRIHHCMRWLGICRRAYDLLVERAANRPIAPFRALGQQQVVQDWIARSRMEIDAARFMVLHAAWRIDREGQKAARDDVSLIKVLVANTLQTVLDRAIQAHGALGVTDDTPLAFWWRHERAARIYDGPDEVHLASVAKRALRARGLDVR
jgi:alkylation response protein AidB-like acyl-CoA dehydrogenase